VFIARFQQWRSIQLPVGKQVNRDGSLAFGFGGAAAGHSEHAGSVFSVKMSIRVFQQTRSNGLSFRKAAARIEPFGRSSAKSSH
jgi:hypothetical protein